MMFRPGPPLDRRELPPRFGFLDVEIDCDAVRVSRAGRPLALEPKAFDLILLLAANPGRVVEKQEIFERLWPDSVVSDNALARVVAHLRRELGDSAEEARVVETVRTRGYRFLPEIQAPSASEPDGLGPGTGFAAASPTASRFASGRVRLAVAGFALAAVVVAGFVLFETRRTRAAGTVPAWTPTPVQRTIEGGYLGSADLSPDGNQLVYSSDAAGGLQLFVRPVEGGRELQITAGGGPKTDAAWSPDGASIAYRDLVAGGLWMVSPSGGPAHQITEFGSQPAWFPDGRRLVFSHPGRPTLGANEWPATYASTLWIVDPRSGEVRQLTEPDRQAGGQGSPAVSPDGRWIYFATGQAAGGGALWRIAAEGGEPECLRLPPDPGQGLAHTRSWLDPTPTPDGKALLAIEVSASRRIVRLDPDGGEVTETLLGPVTYGVSRLAIARQGRRLVYTEERNQTSLEEVELGPTDEVAGVVRVLTAPATQRVTMPAYSPDGARLLFRRLRPGVGLEQIVLDRAGGAPLTIPLEPGPDSVWLPGAVWIAPRRLAFTTPSRRVEFDVETGRLRETPLTLAAADLLARALPRRVVRQSDGRGLAFTAAAPEGDQELYLGDLETGDARQLTRLGRSIDYPFVSRDGRWIGFQVASNQGDDNEIWRVGTTGGTPERFPTAPGPSWGGAFSPDGERIVYLAHREGRWHVAIAGIGRPERLLAVPPETVGYLRWPDWSPDGRYLAYERMHHQASLWTLDLPVEEPGGR